MNWDSYGDFCSLHRAYTDHKQGVIAESNAQNTASPRVTMERDLAKYLDGSRPLHPRRTLDQFYYSSLPDTTVRDRDQTISKWTGSQLDVEGRTAAVNDSLMIMVDQLWCWVLDESKSKSNRPCPPPELSQIIFYMAHQIYSLTETVLSFFPSHDAQYHKNGFINLYDSIRQNCSSCETVWDLYSILIKEAITYLFRQENRRFTDLIETYRWVTGKKVTGFQ